jgi:hypothetical protein
MHVSTKSLLFKRAAVGAAVGIGLASGGFVMAAAAQPTSAEDSDLFGIGISALTAQDASKVAFAESDVEVVLVKPQDESTAVCVEMTVDDAVYDGCIDAAILASGTAFMSVQNQTNDPWVTVGVVPDGVVEVDVGSQSLQPSNNVWVLESETSPHVITVRSDNGTRRTLDLKTD